MPKTVFISCGQYTEEEKELGKQACELVKTLTPFDGYFAQNQTTLKALSENVLRRLYESVGLIVIMHHRGKIEGRDITRASVWIEQEVAMATLMEQGLGRPLHVALFVQRGIAIERIRQQIQLNPVEFTDSKEVIAKLQEILPTWKEPRYMGDEERQALVDSVDLSIAVQTGINFNLTIQIENHSTVDAQVKSIVLWSKGNRICKPVSPQAGVNWTIPAQRVLPIQFNAREGVAGRLANLYNEVWSNRLFRAELEIELRCEILGINKTFKETST